MLPQKHLSKDAQDGIHTGLLFPQLLEGGGDPERGRRPEGAHRQAAGRGPRQVLGTLRCSWLSHSGSGISGRDRGWGPSPQGLVQAQAWPQAAPRAPPRR